LSAPLIWILVPGAIAVVLYFLRRWQRISHVAAVFVTLFLAYLAWQLPIGEAIPLRFWPGLPSITINDSITVLGRIFILDNTSRPALILVYLSIGFWLGGAFTANLNQLFIPLSMSIAALFTASIAIETPLYSILFLQTMALMSVPILSPPGKPMVRGVLRFLTFQTIGMCFLLIGDWMLPVVEAVPGDSITAMRSAILMGLGFALIDAVFPFHTWVPMITRDGHPYATAFILFIFPVAIAFIGLDYLALYSQLSVSPAIYSGLRVTGAIVIIFAGLWAAFQNHLGRILGFAAIMQIGTILLIISLRERTELNPLYLGIFYAQLVPQSLCLALWGLSLITIKGRTPDLSFRSNQGIARRFPFAAAGVILSLFSMAGLPMLAGFPVGVIVWSSLSSNSLNVALLVLVGNIFLFIAGLRTLAVFVMNTNDQTWQISERGLNLALLSLGCLAIILIGVLPQLFLPPLINIPFIYTNPGP